jgi:uncharacterized protein (TIGR02246 family)
MGRRIARIIFGILIILAVPSQGNAGAQEDAYQVIRQWAAAFNAGDLEGVVGAYAPDALVLGTVSPSLATKPADLRTYFGAALAAKSQVKMGDFSAVVLSNDVVVFAGFYEFSRPQDGQAVLTPARFSFVLVKRDDGPWKILQHHSSVRPKPPE